MNEFENKRVVITGGAGGIGTETAKHFLQQGAKVLLVDLHEENLKKVMEELASDHVTYHVADVAQSTEVESYAQKAKDWMGGIDIFFNNAAIEGKVAPLTQYPEDEFDKVIAINIKGVWLGLKYVMPIMAESGGGNIIITSSVAGLQGTPGVVAYTTSKHAIIGTMRTAALEGAEMGIQVNSIHPGPVDNRMMRSLEEGFNPEDAEGVKKNFEQQIPLKRYASNEDIANLVLFLSSEKSKYITGTTYVIDGGMSA